jgi:hypothetical protein
VEHHVVGTKELVAEEQEVIESLFLILLQEVFLFLFKPILLQSELEEQSLVL